MYSIWATAVSSSNSDDQSAGVLIAQFEIITYFAIAQLLDTFSARILDKHSNRVAVPFTWTLAT